MVRNIRSGDKPLEDVERSGRPSEENDEQVKALIAEDNKQTLRELTEKSVVSKTTIVNHLCSLGYQYKLGA